MFSEGLSWIDFRAMRFESDVQASIAMPIIVTYYSGNLRSDQYGDVVSVSPYGDESLALIVTTSNSSGTGDGYLAMRSGSIVAYGYTRGGVESDVNTIRELMPFLRGMVDYAIQEKPNTDEELERILPTYDLLPGGFADFPASDSDYSVGPTPTPIVQTEPRRIEVSGSGDFRAHLEVTPGSYHVSFRCSASGGSASMFSPASFDPTNIIPTGILLTFKDFGGTTTVSLSVRCDGEWSVIGTM
jgi:hypothetical protein